MLTPKMSIFLRMPAMAPDTAKATVPMMSVIKMKSPVSIGDIIYVFERKWSMRKQTRLQIRKFDSYPYSK